ncbi:hypothetical protein LC653_33195 [Nostoc sp. CHAB 5784]|uniref:hypothetical protein n=1 Tax=Nostoc mirabile TaxID=2907820 RepID=UPI001E62334E|nr:hypothetical protein [Nostoc mirabile]MCC5668578.1 hypothetical protein [Nostoc mirabile CHAB5784]
MTSNLHIWDAPVVQRSPVVNAALLWSIYDRRRIKKGLKQPGASLIHTQSRDVAMQRLYIPKILNPSVLLYNQSTTQLSLL